MIYGIARSGIEVLYGIADDVLNALAGQMSCDKASTHGLPWWKE